MASVSSDQRDPLLHLGPNRLSGGLPERMVSEGAPLLSALGISDESQWYLQPCTPWKTGLYKLYANILFGVFIMYLR